MKKFWLILKKLLFIASVICVAVMFVVVLTSAIQKQEQVQCNSLNVKIDYESGLAFLTEEEIKERVNFLSGGALEGKKINTIDFRTIEKEIEKNPYIKNAEIYSDRQQNVWVEILQKRPLIRVMNKDGVGYYISENNDRMPLSDKFTVRLVIALGNVQNNMPQRDSAVQNALYNLVKFINKNVFLHALVDQIEVVEEHNMNLIPKTGGHIIYFGNPTEQVAEKFERLRTFYREGLTKVGWYKYKSINLKFEGQVVCEKADTVPTEAENISTP